MPTDCSTAPQAANPPAALPRTAARLRVGVRHSARSLCLRIACLPAQDGVAHSMSQVLAAADRLLREAGSDKGRITSCELFVRDPAQTADARRMLRGWMAAGLARLHAGLPTVRAHSQAPHLPGANGKAPPLLEMVLVVAHAVDTGQ